MGLPRRQRIAMTTTLNLNSYPTTRALSGSVYPCILFALWAGAIRVIGEGKSIAR